MFKLLYKTGKTEKEFSKLEWIEKPRKENDEISPFFQKHLKKIFPELIFVFKEKRKGIRIKDEDDLSESLKIIKETLTKQASKNE